MGTINKEIDEEETDHSTLLPTISSPHCFFFISTTSTAKATTQEIASGS